MDLKEAVSKRHTTHRFCEYTPSEAIDTRALLELALSVPNHHKTKPWKILAPAMEVRKSLYSIAVERYLDKTQKKSLDDADEAKLFAKYTAPKEVYIFVNKLSGDKTLDKENYATQCCSVYAFSLLLAAENLESKWSTGWWCKSQKVFEALTLNKDLEEIVAVLWVGQSKVKNTVKADLNLNDYLVEL